MELAQIDATAAANGTFHSGGRLKQVHRAHERELEVRTIIAWESLVRVHRALGAPLTGTLRDDLKAEMQSQIAAYFQEIDESFRNAMSKSRLGAGLSLDLDEAKQHVTAKQDVEIDVYVDSLSVMLSSQSATVEQSYNFYGAVGAVQTGASAVANVVQNLSSDDQRSLMTALEEVRKVLAITPDLPEQQRRDLVEIADECSSQMAAQTPNNTKLLTMFNVLGTAIQSIASAGPAYHALKSAVLPLGLTLP